MGPIQSGVNQILSTAMFSLGGKKFLGQHKELSKNEAKRYVQKIDAEQEAGYKELQDIEARIKEHESGARPLSDVELKDAQERATGLNKKLVDIDQLKKFNPEYGRAIRKQSKEWQDASAAREAFKRGKGPMPTDEYNHDVNESFAMMNPTSRTAMMKTISGIQERISQREESERLRNMILNPGEV